MSLPEEIWVDRPPYLSNGEPNAAGDLIADYSPFSSASVKYIRADCVAMVGVPNEET